MPPMFCMQQTWPHSRREVMCGLCPHGVSAPWKSRHRPMESEWKVWEDIRSENTTEYDQLAVQVVITRPWVGERSQGGSDQEHFPWDLGFELRRKGQIWTWRRENTGREHFRWGRVGGQNWLEWALEVYGVCVSPAELVRWHIGEQGEHWGRSRLPRGREHTGLDSTLQATGFHTLS